MIVDYSPRQGGKTTRMMEWLSEDPGTRYVITYSPRERQRLQDKYPDVSHRIKTWREYAEMQKGGHLQGRHGTVAIDNVDMILENLLNRTVEFISVTEQNEQQT